jgi:hypothetical protein
MNIIAAIRNFLKPERASHDSDHDLKKEDNQRRRISSQNDTIKNTVESEPGLEFLDGMSTGTARFIIDREVSPDQLEKYDIKDLENKGRYYLAKIVNQDGEVADTVLIDKLNRSIHFQKAKFK